MKLRIGIIMIAALVFLSGCGQDELENRAFPLAMGVGAGTGNGYVLYMAYPDLTGEETKENPLKKDQYWSAELTDLMTGLRKCSEENNRNVDMNHLKVLILDKSLLTGTEQAEELIAFFREKKNAAWNTYVLLTDGDPGDLFQEQENMHTCLGIYLEDLLEGWEGLRPGALVTVGDLVSQYYNHRDTLLIPEVTAAEDGPGVRNLIPVKDLTCGGRLDLDHVLEHYDTLKTYRDE